MTTTWSEDGRLGNSQGDGADNREPGMDGVGRSAVGLESAQGKGPGK